MKKTFVCDNPYICTGAECKESKVSCKNCQWYSEDNAELIADLTTVQAKERELQKKYHALTGVYYKPF